MRTIYGLLLISLLMFVTGVAFIVVAALNTGKAPATAPSASVRQLMQGMVTPASSAIYNAVSTTITENGVEEVFPRSDREWEIVGSHAMVLVEAAGLLKVDGRAKDSGAWMRMADAMRTAAMQADKAADEQSTDALLAAGEVLNNSCDNCHRYYDVAVE